LHEFLLSSQRLTGWVDPSDQAFAPPIYDDAEIVVLPTPSRELRRVDNDDRRGKLAADLPCGGVDLPRKKFFAKPFWIVLGSSHRWIVGMAFLLSSRWRPAGSSGSCPRHCQGPRTNLSAAHVRGHRTAHGGFDQRRSGHFFASFPTPSSPACATTSKPM